MRKLQLIVLLLLVFAAGVATALSITLTGPSTYADTQWKSVCLSNKNADGNYVGVIEVCPTSSDPNNPGACSTSTRLATTVPSSYQTFINAWIGFWRTDHPGY